MLLSATTSDAQVSSFPASHQRASQVHQDLLAFSASGRPLCISFGISRLGGRQSQAANLQPSGVVGSMHQRS